MASFSSSTSGTTKEAFLEKKMMMLEKRLTSVEKFLEARFCQLIKGASKGSSQILNVWSESKERENPNTGLAKVSNAKRESFSPQKSTLLPSCPSTTQSPSLLALGITKELRIHLTRSTTKTGPLSLKPSANEAEAPDPCSDADEGNELSSQTQDLSDDYNDFGDTHDGNDADGNKDYFCFPNAEKKVDLNKFAGGKYIPNYEDGGDEDSDWEPETADCNSNDDEDQQIDNENNERSLTEKTSKRKLKPKSSNSAPKRWKRKKKSFEVRKEPSQLKWRTFQAGISILPSGAKLITTDSSLKECPTCHMHFKEENFAAHLVLHTKEKTVKCPDCDKMFTSSRGLQKHAPIHNTAKYARNCRLCSKVFYRNDKALHHERICIRHFLMKGEEVDASIMEDVRNRSKNLEDLNWPIINEDSKEETECLKCGKLFPKWKMEMHMKSHVELPKNWKCSFCDKGYANKRSLVRHLCIVHRDSQNSAEDQDNSN